MITSIMVTIGIACLLGLLFYFLPWFVASNRNHVNSGMIGFLNLVFGWTILGWILLMLWAIFGESRNSHTSQNINVNLDGLTSYKSPQADGSPISSADELTKLSGLLDKGLITKAEFDKMKSRFI